jgi:hypothetical protein
MILPPCRKQRMTDNKPNSTDDGTNNPNQDECDVGDKVATSTGADASPVSDGKDAKPNYGYSKANWTEILAFLAAIGGIGSAIFSGVSAYRASEANAISSKALTEVQRAFITVSELKQDPITDKDGKVSSWRFTPIIKNSGTTPAEAVTLVSVIPHQEFIARPRNLTPERYGFVSFKVGAPRDPDELIAERESVPVYLSNFAIGPQGGVTASQLSDELTINDVQNSFANRIGRFFYGSIHYSDVFETQHISKFCFRTDGMTIRGPGDAFPLQSLCKHWNCTDQSCVKDKESYERELRAALAEYEARPSRPTPTVPAPVLPWPTPSVQPSPPITQPNP